MLQIHLHALSVFRLVTESGAVLGGRPDLLHHLAGTVLRGYGGICRGEVSRSGFWACFLPPYLLDFSSITLLLEIFSIVFYRQDNQIVLLYTMMNEISVLAFGTSQEVCRGKQIFAYYYVSNKLYSCSAPVYSATEVIDVFVKDLTGSVLCLGSEPRGVRWGARWRHPPSLSVAA